MNKVDRLIKYTQDVYNGQSKKSNYSSIYFHSNEYLKGIFDEVDVNGKDVLTVLGSGDQALYMYDRGAKSIDFFDKNNLTLYYYYLRVWTIKYLDIFYPEIFFKNDFLNKLLKIVKPQTIDEKIAYLYWKKYIWYFAEYDNDDFEELFIIGNDPKRNELYDLNKIKEKLEYEKYVFNNIDITSKGLDFGKKYDVIFTSNISDRIHSDKQMTSYKNNLLNHLNENGVIVCSDVIRYDRSRLEASIFDIDMDFKRINKSFYGFDYRSPGHVYVRKKI